MHRLLPCRLSLKSFLDFNSEVKDRSGLGANERRALALSLSPFTAF
jgi:hypothetical protein